MMRNRLRVRLLLLGCWTLTCSAGCAGHSQFEQTARVTLGQTAAYQNEVDSKVAQENAYRSEMLGILQASADRKRSRVLQSFSFSASRISRLK